MCPIISESVCIGCLQPLMSAFVFVVSCLPSVCVGEREQRVRDVCAVSILVYRVRSESALLLCV